MLAYHSDPKIKRKFVARMTVHKKADEIIQGNPTACAVSCTLEGVYDHSQYPIQLGFPEQIARLHDGIFEGLPKKTASQFALDLLKAPKPGADLSLVWPKFLLAVLSDPKHGVLRHVQEDKFKEQKVAILAVIRMFEDWTKTGSAPTANAARSAESAARSAESAAWNAAWSAAWKWQAATLIRLMKEAK